MKEGLCPKTLKSDMGKAALAATHCGKLKDRTLAFSLSPLLLGVLGGLQPSAI